MKIQQRLLKFVSRSNWILLAITSLVGLILAPPKITFGIFAGGLIVTINFHLLYRTLKRAFRPPHLISYNLILIKYYLRFIGSGIVIFFLIFKHYVNPLGLFIGLSLVVASIGLATLCELKKLIFKEAV